MAFRVRHECYTCENRQIPRVMAFICGDENAIVCEIAIARRDENGRPPAEVTPDTRVCNNCIVTIRREIEILANDPQCLRLNVLSQTSSQTCLVCNGINDIHRLTLECRVDIFVKRNIYIPRTHVCCRLHLDERGWLLQALIEGLRYINRPYRLNGEEAQSFLQGMREEIKRSAERRYEDEHGVTNEEFQTLYSLTKVQFNDLYSFCDPVPVPRGHRYISKKDLLCFLCKLSHSLSDDFLCVMFYYPSRQSTGMQIATVRQSLSARFCHGNIGFDAMTREEFIERHVTPFANQLYNHTPQYPRAIVYIDCTYLDIEKSSCFQVLRQSFCVHKHKHLVKPSVIVGPDGYILDIQGPYFSNALNNDARILLNELNRDVNGMQNWFQEGDIVIVDRGYQNSIQTLQGIGLITRMPPLLDRNQNQFRTEEANESRIVTKTRWIVEARNGHLKSIFSFFSNTIPTSHATNLSDFLRIAGAIINRYYGPINMPNANEALANHMLEQAQQVNIVQARVEADNLGRRRARWILLTPAHIPLFPQMTVNELQALTFGTYQVYLAPSYMQDSSLRAEREDDEQEDMTFEIDANTNEPGFIRIRLFSRYRNATRYQLWIAFDEEHNGGEHGEQDPILGYYCTCKAGARTLGTCAHIASIIWYLSYARHHEGNVHYPSLRLLHTVMNAQMDIGNPNGIEIIDPDLHNG
ncbi:uncharacterized protein LOC131672967 [Phymastichus coffea]|uniref:uncharacterized protein LOC131672967 n=1 Tax=Phymastichus coffea TaxID=108790 RepID=UPI00273C5237|nr:uncharacterized protein LOC131672967 [Phymastichus coffea]